jgi:hypothetical protein
MALPWETNTKLSVVARAQLQVVGLAAVGWATYQTGCWVALNLGVPVQYAAAFHKPVPFPTRLHYLCTWNNGNYDPNILRNMARAGDVVGPPRVYSERDVDSLVSKFDSQHPGFATTYAAIPLKITKTDIGRLLLVYYYGGIYLDGDVVFRTPFELAANGTWFVEKTVDVTALGPREAKHPVRVANYAFGAYPLSPLIRLMLLESARRCKFLISQNDTWSDSDIVWAAGPDVVTTLYHDTKGIGAVLKSKRQSASHLVHIGKGHWKKNQPQLGTVLVVYHVIICIVSVSVVGALWVICHRRAATRHH